MPARRNGVTLALLVVAILGVLQFAFLAFIMRNEIRHDLILLESAVLVVASLGLIYLVVREDRLAAEADADAQSVLSDFVDFAADLYWEIDLEGTVIAAGGRLRPALMPDINRVVGRRYFDLVHLEPEALQKMRRALNALQPYSDIPCLLRGPDGNDLHVSLSATPRHDRDGRAIGYLSMATNVTRQVETQTRLKHLARNDLLTGLANRQSFQRGLERQLSISGEDENVALLAIDLDQFTIINDTFGLRIGDAVLKTFATRLKASLGDGVQAARIGGDRFAVIISGVTNPMDVCLFAARLIKALSQPYKIGGLELSVSASIGIACAPLHASDTKSLMKSAHDALAQARGEGGACYRLYRDATTRPAMVS